MCLNKILQYRHIFTSPHRPIHPPTLRSRECLCSKLAGSRGGNWRKPRAWRQTISQAATGSDATFSWVRFKDPGDYGLWGAAEKPRDFILCFLLQGRPTDFPLKCLNVFFAPLIIFLLNDVALHWQKAMVLSKAPHPKKGISQFHSANNIPKGWPCLIPS